jgi:hypothetical protein
MNLFYKLTGNRLERDPNRKETGRKRKKRLGRGLVYWRRGTLARPKTREYRRFLKQPQYPGHIKEINKVYKEAA